MTTAKFASYAQRADVIQIRIDGRDDDDDDVKSVRVEIPVDVS